MSQIIEGGCYCGNVRYRITGAVSNSMVCHCESCRRISAAPVVAAFSVGKKFFSFVKGDPTYFHSSKPVTRSFCPQCGTPLTYENTSYAETIDVTTCSLDNAEAFAPTYHSWLSDDLEWVKFDDGLPTFSQSRTSS